MIKFPEFCELEPMREVDADPRRVRIPHEGIRVPGSRVQWMAANCAARACIGATIKQRCEVKEAPTTTSLSLYLSLSLLPSRPYVTVKHFLSRAPFQRDEFA